VARLIVVLALCATAACGHSNPLDEATKWHKECVREMSAKDPKRDAAVRAAGGDFRVYAFPSGEITTITAVGLEGRNECIIDEAKFKQSVLPDLYDHFHVNDGDHSSALFYSCQTNLSKYEEAYNVALSSNEKFRILGPCTK
jgi:hypothetical protein